MATPHLIVFLLALAGAEPPGGVALLRLRLHAAVSSRLVHVADIADITAPPALREHIARLDVAEVADEKAGLSVTAKQVGFRLRLAGLSAAAFHVEGDTSHVTPRFRTVTPEEVVDKARQGLMAGLPWTPAEVQVTLAQPVVVALPAVADDDELAITAKPGPGSRPPGRVQVDVQIFVKGRARLSLGVYFNVRPCMAVAVCKRRVEKGKDVTEADIYVEQQPVTGDGRDLLGPDAVKGRKAKRALLPGQMIKARDIEDPVADGAAMVKAQQPVKMRVRVGGLSIDALGQALQDGRQGQLIRVQNVDSKKVLTGRVVAQSLVEIE
jgi:flagella basal body P-ring formation protein FlgA